MKTKNLLIVLLSVFVFMATGCSKDKEETESSGYITYDGVKHDLNWGMLENYGAGTKGSKVESYNFDVTLFSSGVTYNETNEEPEGTGSGILFELFSSSATALVNGDYLYDSEATYAPLTFDYSMFVIDYNFETSTGTSLYIASGTLTVTKSGDDYELTFNCLDDDSNAVTGYYKGKLKYYDYTSFAKAGGKTLK